jgi:glycosyltransferase involved in cell wall biosynthesis
MQSKRPHVLVVAYDFPPHAAIGTMRTLRVVQQLARQGWEITVLTSDPRTFREGTPVDHSLLSRVPAAVRIVRAPVYRGFDRLKRFVKRGRRASGGNGSAGTSTAARPTRRLLGSAIDVVDAALAIPDHESGWFVPAVARGLSAARRRRPDLVYSSAPPWTGQLVAAALAGSLRCPWVADFRDPWSRAPWRGDRFRFAIRAAHMLERAVVRRTDHILFVARGNREDFAAHYGARLAAKMHVVPNGCDPSEFDDIPHPVDGGGPFVLLHAGSLYAGRTPVPVLRAVACAIRDGAIEPSRFRLRFLGHSGGTSVDIASACRDLGIEPIVEFAPRVARKDGLAAMMSASALLLLQPGHTVSVPGKLYEYLAAGRPILALAEEGETADIVRASGIGISVSPDREADLVPALLSIMRMAGSNLTPPPRALFDGVALAAETVELLGAVVRGEGIRSCHTSGTLNESVRRGARS